MTGVSKRETLLSERSLIAALALVYGVSYLARYDYSAALVEIASELRLSNAAAGIAVTGQYAAYGAGQLVSGAFGDRVKPATLIAAGLLGTALCNVLVYLLHNIAAISVVWCVNGLFQALLWPPIVRVMAESLSEAGYRRACVLVGAGASAATIAVYLLVPACIRLSSWRSAFLLVALLCAATALAWLAMSGRVRARSCARAAGGEARAGRAGLRAVAGASGLGLVCAAIVLHGMLRDGVATWMPAYINEVFHLDASRSILLTALLPAFAIVSMAVATAVQKVTRNELKSAALIFGAGALAAAVLMAFYQSSAFVAVAMMAVLTGCMHGVNLLLISRAPLHFADTGHLAFLSGAMNACTYIGSALSAYGFAALCDRFGWRFTIALWAAIALIGAAICALCVKRWLAFIRRPPADERQAGTVS